MKVSLSIFCLFLFASLAAAQDVSRLSWLSGCWQSDAKSETNFVSEIWTKPAGETMFGIGRTIKNGKTTAFENLRIVRQDGTLFYIARPSDAKVDTPFKLKTLSEKEAIFENPEHDFPQRIIYRLGENNTLVARVEGTKNGKTSGFDFPFVRIKCE